MISDICDFLVDNRDPIIGVITSIIGIASAVSAKVFSSRTKRLINDRLKGHYIICPHCKQMVDLDNEVHFYLPDGSKDDDLNGEKDPD